jgi:hypothetical protein
VNEPVGLPRDELTPYLWGFGFAGRISVAPTPYPNEFRRDVIAVARQGEESIA